MSPSTSTKACSPVPTFQSIGVRPVINGMGTFTILSGSRALPQVVDAMREATNAYVEIGELMDCVGARLAELTGAPWGYVSSGCAAALAEITAAAIAGADPEKMARLPDTTGMRNEVVIQRCHRNTYDRAILGVGARIIEVETVADLRAAMSERTALVEMTSDDGRGQRIPNKQMIAVAREYGIPSLVDAAAERPDVPNRYLEMGADAVAYSGGKCLRGPQASGLVLGRKDLLKAAFINGAPYHSVGRPMKAGKEEIMGLLAAVEAWVSGRDHEAEWRMWEGWLDCIDAAVRAIPSVSTSIRQPGLSNVAPNLVITWDAATLGHTSAQVFSALWEGEPCIRLHATDRGVTVNPYMMEDGDAEIIAKRLSALLSAPAAAQPKAPDAPATDVSGAWEVCTRYVLGESRHGVTLEQDGAALSGVCRSPFEASPVTGCVAGNQVEFRTRLGHHATRNEYVFYGTVDGDAMSGTVTLGEFGRAEWSAQRVQ